MALRVVLYVFFYAYSSFFLLSIFIGNNFSLLSGLISIQLHSCVHGVAFT